MVENSLECCPTSAVGDASILSKDGMELGMREANLTVLLGAPGLRALVETQANALPLLKGQRWFLQQIEQLLEWQSFRGQSRSGHG